MTGYVKRVRLFDALHLGRITTEEDFLALLERCGKAEVKYRRDTDGKTVLMEMAAKHDWPKAAAALIERGYDVNPTNKRGYTALHDVAYSNHRETARVLLEHGADRTIKNTDRRTAADVARSTGNYDLAAYIDGINSAARLFYAAGQGTAEAIFLEVLRGCGDAEVKYRDEFQNTVLMLMSMYHDWGDAAAALIERGCDVDGTSITVGSTALHLAGFANRRETARVLLERGADRTIKNKYGETAAEYARKYGKTHIAAYIDGFGLPVTAADAPSLVPDVFVKEEPAAVAAAPPTSAPRRKTRAAELKEHVTEVAPEAAARMAEAAARAETELLKRNREAAELQERARAKRLKRYDDVPCTAADHFKCPNLACNFHNLYPLETRACNKLACGNCGQSFCIKCGKGAAASCSCIAAAWAR